MGLEVLGDFAAAEHGEGYLVNIGRLFALIGSSRCADLTQLQGPFTFAGF